jgi:hypothetical protein
MPQANENAIPSDSTEIEELNPNALYFEPREFLDEAIIARTTGPSTRPSVLVYDRELLRQALAEMFHDSLLADAATDLEAGETVDDYDLDVLENDIEESVDEWLSYNTEGADMGVNSPIIIQLFN